jgi:hypothetical protein
MALHPVTPLSRSIVTFGLSVSLLALGLANRDLVHCSTLDPEHPIALSNYFEARGLPFAWLATANGTCGDIRDVRGRILWSPLLWSVVFWVAVATLGGFLLPRRTRGDAYNPDNRNRDHDS